MDFRAPAETTEVYPLYTYRVYRCDGTGNNASQGERDFRAYAQQLDRFHQLDCEPISLIYTN
jgi:hypothetical protein